MTSMIERRLKALESRNGIGYRPIKVCCYDGTRRDHEEQVATEAAKAEANGEQLFSVFFVPPTS